MSETTAKSMVTSDNENSNKNFDLLEKIKSHIRRFYEVFSDNMRNYKQDRMFAYLVQWNSDQIWQLNTLHKPILQSNIIYDIINKMIAEYRSNTGDLMVQPESDGISKEEIELAESYLRKICFDSDPEVAYQQAFETVVSGGFGAIEVMPDYEHPDSPHQIPFIIPKKEPEKCGFDIFAKKSCKEDGHWCFEYFTMSREDFEREYPDIPYPQSFPDQYNGFEFTWGDKDAITLVKYQEKEFYDFTLNVLDNGESYRDEKLKEVMDQYNQQKMMYEQLGEPFDIPEPRVIKKIKKKDCRIKFYKVIFDRVIEQKDLPGNKLGLVFVPGPSICLDGRETFVSAVRYAKDTQVLCNYAMIEIAYSLSIARREQFIGTAANVKGYEQDWANPSVVQGMLTANVDPEIKTLPTKLPNTEIPTTIMQLFTQSKMAVHDCMGYFEANTGKDSLEKSGIAIEKQQLAGSLSAIVIKSNVDRAIEAVGNIVQSMTEELFDAEREITVIDANRKYKRVTISPGQISSKKFKVLLRPGPSFTIQREKSLEILLELIRAYPPTAPLVADFLAEKSGFDNTPALVDRLKTLVPPDIMAKENGEPPPPPQPDPQAIFAQKQLQIEEQKLQLEEQKIQTEREKLKAQLVKIDSDIRTALIKADAETRKASIDHNASMVDATAKIVNSHDNLKSALYQKLFNKQ